MTEWERDRRRMIEKAASKAGVHLVDGEPVETSNIPMALAVGRCEIHKRDAMKAALRVSLKAVRQSNE